MPFTITPHFYVINFCRTSSDGGEGGDCKTKRKWICQSECTIAATCPPPILFGELGPGTPGGPFDSTYREGFNLR